MAEAQPPSDDPAAGATPSADPPPATHPAASAASPDTAALAGDGAGIDPAAAMPSDVPVSLDQFSIEELLSQASFEDPAKLQAGGGGDVDPGSAAAEFKLPNFTQVMHDAQSSSIDLLRDVELNVKIELGRSRMMVEDVLKLAEGSVVELDKLAGDPVDVFVNDRLVARGEVLVLNDNFCVRVNEIVAATKEEAV
jgi:flagellar motor switch protein FliN/FliY